MTENGMVHCKRMNLWLLGGVMTYWSTRPGRWLSGPPLFSSSWPCLWTNADLCCISFPTWCWGLSSTGMGEISLRGSNTALLSVKFSRNDKFTFKWGLSRQAWCCIHLCQVSNRVGQKMCQFNFFRGRLICHCPFIRWESLHWGKNNRLTENEAHELLQRITSLL